MMNVTLVKTVFVHHHYHHLHTLTARILTHQQRSVLINNKSKFTVVKSEVSSMLQRMTRQGSGLNLSNGCCVCVLVIYAYVLLTRFCRPQKNNSTSNTTTHSLLLKLTITNVFKCTSKIHFGRTYTLRKVEQKFG